MLVTHVTRGVVPRRPSSCTEHVLRVVLHQLAALLVRLDLEIHAVHFMAHCLLRYYYCYNKVHTNIFTFL